MCTLLTSQPISVGWGNKWWLWGCRIQWPTRCGITWHLQWVWGSNKWSCCWSRSHQSDCAYYHDYHHCTPGCNNPHSYPVSDTFAIVVRNTLKWAWIYVTHWSGPESMQNPGIICLNRGSKGLGRQQAILIGPFLQSLLWSHEWCMMVILSYTYLYG